MNLSDDSLKSDDKIPVLEAADLCCSFRRNGRTVHALDHISLELKQGTILGIVGESGSGKSTLIRHIACLMQPSSGRLYYRGSEYTGKTAAFAGQYMQMVFQDALTSFDPRVRLDKSVREARKGPEDPKLLKQLLEDVRLDESFLTRYPGQLSGGQCQRMSLVRAVYSGVKILLCDEVTSALDTASQAMVIELLKDLKEKYGMSVIFVSHDLAVVSQLCDEVMVMQNGRCVERGSCMKVISRPEAEYTKRLLGAALEFGITTL